MKHPPFSSVVQSTELPSLSTDRHLVYPLKASFALRKGDLVDAFEILHYVQDDTPFSLSF